MTIEKHDPWALLRDARESIAQDFDSGPAGRRTLLDLLKRIDAALAEHADSAQSAVESEVEWTQDAFGHYARVKVEAEIEVFQDLSGEWQWNRTALSDVRRYGYANTLDEAKSAAIAAARGIK